MCSVVYGKNEILFYCKINPFKQAKKLQDLGVLFCLSYEGDMEAMGARNLSFTAGTTVAYGQEHEKAIESITLNAAKELKNKGVKIILSLIHI